MLLVVAYDIADDRRRTRLHTALHGYCVPVQESVFECEVTSRQSDAVKKLVARIVRPRSDKIRYYPLCEQCSGSIEDEHGATRPEAPEVYIV